MSFSHEFSHTPIRLHHIDVKNNKLKCTYIFVGNIPDNVFKALQMLENSDRKIPQVVLNYYGKKIKERLTIPEKIGGFSASNDSDESSDFSEVSDRILDEVLASFEIEGGSELFVFRGKHLRKLTAPKGKLPYISGGVEDNEIDFDSANEITLDDISQINEAPAIEEAVESSDAKLKIMKTGIYPFDTILDFKYKIYLATGIPLYRQHLSAFYKGHMHPLSYSVQVNNHHINVSAERLLSYYRKEDSENITEVEGVPIDMYFYRNKEFTTIRAYDTITLLKFLYEQQGVLDYYLIDMSDIIDFKSISAKLLSDRYIFDIVYNGFVSIYFPIMTYTMFSDFLKNESQMMELYPKARPEKLSLRAIFDNDSRITEEAFAIAESKARNSLSKRLFSSIKETKLSIDNFKQDVDLLLNIRDFFDAIKLDDYITYAKASILHNENTIASKYQNIILHKSYHREQEPKENLVLNSILLKIRLNLDTNEHMFMHFFKNGNYVIHSKWREEQHMTFEKITEVVAKYANPIITFINQNQQLKYHNVNIPLISKHNAVFTETGFIFHYNSDITDMHYKVFRNILHDYVKAGIITEKETKSYVGVSEDDKSNILEYFFNKGMHKFDISRIEKSITTNNYYEFLSNAAVFQKWKTIFENTRAMIITNLMSRIKVEISGIRNQAETEIFHMYLMALFHLFEENTAGFSIDYEDVMKQKNKKLLKNLKAWDPVLYNLKMYKSSIVYSKICQKPYQPVMLTENEYKKLPENTKKNTIKYWNFTRREPVWYRCPNSKYPYIKFITNQHPSGYCIPCCKKLEMNEKVNIKKQEIHRKCLTDHEYKGDKVILTKGNHYIATYGKTIEVGRLSRLPENTLEPLFFDTYSPEGGMDSECFKSEGYYIMGIDQNTPALSKIGLIYCVMHSLNMGLDNFLEETAKRIRESPDKFNIILEGTISLYFGNYEELCEAILQINKQDVRIQNINLDWNMLFKSIAYHYFGINVIIFNDKSKEQIEFVLPVGLSTVDEMFPNTHLNLVLICFRSNYYPIYLVNAELYKKIGIIETRLFVNESGIIVIIRAIIGKCLENRGTIQNKIDLTVCKKFSEHTKKAISKYYINAQNQCYAVGFSSGEYIPIDNSYYSPDKDIVLDFEPLSINDLVDYSVYSSFCKSYNRWVMQESKAAGLENITIYPLIQPKQWIKHTKIIGFVANDLYFYMRPIVEKKAIDLENIPIQIVLHNPLSVNKMLYNIKEKTGTVRIGWSPEVYSTIQHDLYNYHLYHLVLLQFITLFKKQKNTAMRKKLIDVIAKTKFNVSTAPIRHFINDEIESFDDKEKLKILLASAIKHDDKKKLIADIGESYFEFDFVEMDRMKTKTLPEIKKRLYELSKDIIIIGKVPDGITFPNILTSCRNDQDYCKMNKLIVPKNRIDEIFEIIANDISNDFKQKWLFNELFINRYVNFFKFQKRPNETIFIEIAN